MNAPLKTHWYVALLVLESCIVEGLSDPTVDVQYRLIRAPDAEAAYERALSLGRDSEQSYENSYGQTCVWSFKGLKDLQKVVEDELADGIEVYGFIEDGSSADRVVPKARLTVFNQGVPDVGETAPPEIGGE